MNTYWTFIKRLRSSRISRAGLMCLSRFGDDLQVRMEDSFVEYHGWINDCSTIPHLLDQNVCKSYWPYCSTNVARQQVRTWSARSHDLHEYVCEAGVGSTNRNWIRINVLTNMKERDWTLGYLVFGCLQQRHSTVALEWLLAKFAQCRPRHRPTLARRQRRRRFGFPGYVVASGFWSACGARLSKDPIGKQAGRASMENYPCARPTTA